jgi:hypothetical protein
VKVWNRESESITHFFMEDHNVPAVHYNFSPPYVLGAGASFLFLIGAVPEEIVGSSIEWAAKPICQGDPTQEGFIVTAAFSSSSVKSREYAILCDGSRLTSGHRKRNNNKHKRHKKRSQKQKSGTHD